MNKQRSDYGDTKAEKKKDREGKPPVSGLPIRNYQQKTAGEVRSKLRHMDRDDIKKLERYERKHKNRKTSLESFTTAHSWDRPATED